MPTCFIPLPIIIMALYDQTHQNQQTHLSCFHFHLMSFELSSSFWVRFISFLHLYVFVVIQFIFLFKYDLILLLIFLLLIIFILLIIFFPLINVFLHLISFSFPLLVTTFISPHLFSFTSSLLPIPLSRD
jgi:hypothetical protein